MAESASEEEYFNLESKRSRKKMQKIATYSTPVSEMTQLIDAMKASEERIGYRELKKKDIEN